MAERNTPALAAPRFENGHKKHGGRRPGSMNKNSRVLKDCIILAAEEFGRDGRGKDGLKGYLLRLAAYEPVAYASLLRVVLPIQIKDVSDNPAPSYRIIERVIIDGATGEVIPPPPVPRRRPMRTINADEED